MIKKGTLAILLSSLSGEREKLIYESLFYSFRNKQIYCENKKRLITRNIDGWSLIQLLIDYKVWTKIQRLYVLLTLSLHRGYLGSKINAKKSSWRALYTYRPVNIFTDKSNLCRGA